MNQILLRCEQVMGKQLSKYSSAVDKSRTFADQGIYNLKPARRTRRGTKAGRNFFRPISTVISISRSTQPMCQAGVNFSNFAQLIWQSDKSTLCPPHLETECSIPTILQTRNTKSMTSSIVNYSNIVHIPVRKPAQKQANLFTLNCRSVKNKTLAIDDFIQSHSVDILALTETWLGTSIDNNIVSEKIPSGYNIQHVSSDGKRGEGM